MKRQSSVKRGSRLISGFVEKAPVEKKYIDAPARMRVALLLGQLTNLVYTATDGNRYIHTFRRSSQPKLVVSADGKQLAIVGGKYQFTRRGIVDK